MQTCRPTVGPAEALAKLAGDLHAAPNLDTLLERAVAFATAEIGCDCAGVVLWPGHGLDQQLAAGSDWRVAKADQLQRVVGEGPGTSPLGTDAVIIRSTHTAAEWPRWGPRVAAQLGLRTVMSAVLTAGARRAGVLNLYALREEAFTPHDQFLTRSLAAHLAVAVTVSVTASTLQRALESHSQVGQATGVLMERFDLSADEAFTVLRHESQNLNVPLRAVAANVLATRRHHGVPGGQCRAG